MTLFQDCWNKSEVYWVLKQLVWKWVSMNCAGEACILFEVVSVCYLINFHSSVTNVLAAVLSPHRRFGKQTLWCPRAHLNSSLAPNYGAWLAQLPQCPDAPHASHPSPEGPNHDAALLPSGEGKSACRCQGKMTAEWRLYQTYFSGNVTFIRGFIKLKNTKHSKVN